MGAKLVNSLLFPAPNPPHYLASDFDNLIYIPRREGRQLSIPCLLFRVPQAKHLMVYVHGNGCDVGDMYQELRFISRYLRVHIMAMELRGYGFNKGDSNETNVNEDMEDVYIAPHSQRDTTFLDLF